MRNDPLNQPDTATLYALLALAEPATGAEIHRTAQSRSSAKFTHTTTYKSLSRMHQRGYVTCEERTKHIGDGDTPTARLVKYYEITDSGRTALLSARRLHEEMTIPPMAKLPEMSFRSKIALALRRLAGDS